MPRYNAFVRSPLHHFGQASKDPIVADVMKSHGYSSSPLSQNQLGDRPEILPWIRGFDQFLATLIA